jgi:hypothetical protein
METMNMNHLIPCLLLICAALVSTPMVAQKAVKMPVKSTISGKVYSGPEFDEFVAKEAWVFVEDQTKSAGYPDLDGAMSAVEGGTPLSAKDFDPATFDSRNYQIDFQTDPTLPTNFNVGDRGVIQFHSAERCQDLFARHLARKTKGQ